MSRNWKPLNRDAIEGRIDYLVANSIWAPEPEMNPAGWLQNFKDSDLDYAFALLQFFTYIPDRWTNELFRSAMQGISQQVCDVSTPFVTQQNQWRSFIANTVITYVAGEKPNPTDSGYNFARRARDVCRFPENKIMHPAAAFIEARDRNRNVIFVDDFIGSGSQTFHTWTRTYDTSGVARFIDLIPNANQRFVYAPLVAAKVGIERVRPACPNLTILPLHILDPSYSALSDNSSVWPDGMRDEGIEFIRRVSLEHGMPDTNGSQPDDWQGFARLGLCFAFEHSLPDATMPIFYWEEDGWIPLKRRP